MIVTTTNEISDRRIVEYLGVVRGLVVRATGVLSVVKGGIRSILGGNIVDYEEVCERAREDAFQRMVCHAEEIGADAVLGTRYDATEFIQGTTEVLVYGTAVRFEK